MTFDAVKDKLHEYIEHADQSKVMAMYTLLSGNMEPGDLYDEVTLNMLEATRDNMINGSERTYTLAQTTENIKNHRNRHGV